MYGARMRAGKHLQLLLAPSSCEGFLPGGVGDDWFNFKAMSSPVVDSKPYISFHLASQLTFHLASTEIR